MGRFLTTLPTNYGLYNLGTVEAYPTGGSGPTAYGPTSYFGSDPLPERKGDSLYNPLELGNLSAGFKSIDITNKHGGNTRIQSTFYRFILTAPRSVQLIQNYSTTSYQSTTNRNTIVSIYKLDSDNTKRELPINDNGYVYKENSIVDEDSYSAYDEYQSDYPTQPLEVGTYILLITNDIRYLETTYSITITSAVVDWGEVTDSVALYFDFGSVTGAVNEVSDFGLVRSDTSSGSSSSSGSGLGYTRAGVSP
jgi:hypothetical protein